LDHGRCTVNQGVRIRVVVGILVAALVVYFVLLADRAIALITSGSAAGIALGIGGAQAITLIKNWPTMVSAESILIAFVFSAAVGIFFGFYPARKASQLDPIEALRYE